MSFIIMLGSSYVLVIQYVPVHIHGQSLLPFVHRSTLDFYQQQKVYVMISNNGSL